MKRLSALTLAALAGVYACTPEPPPPAAPAAPPPVASPAVAAPPATALPPSLVHVQILAINDFHGNLEPPQGSSGYVVGAPADPIAAALGPDAGVKTLAGGTKLIPAGGAAYLATHIKRLKSENPNTVIVSAGDLTGASPLLSNLLKDEPTVLVMNEVGLDCEGVGNHDFDRGLDELLRLQRGDGAFPGAKYRILGANVLSTSSHEPALPPYAIRELGGAKVAFVGETLEATPTVTIASAVKGLTFAPEAATVNALVPKLKEEGVSAIVLLIHQGGFQGPGGTYDSCEAFGGPLLSILKGDAAAGRPPLDPAVDVVASGHNHQAYDCTIDGRLVTSAASYGRLLTKIDLTIDPEKHAVVAKTAKNIPVTRDVPEDPEVLRLVSVYHDQAAPIMNRVVGYIRSDLVGDAKVAGSASCETPLGDLIADAQLAATRGPAHGGADLAFMNPGGVRADLVAKPEAGAKGAKVTYAQAFEVQPFGNEVVTMTLDGAQLHTLLEQQFGAQRVRILDPSEGFTYAYSYDAKSKRGTVDPRSMRLRGAPVLPGKPYRVTVNSFLADGGDEFSVLKDGASRTTGPRDIESLTAYLSKGSSAAAPLVPKPATRVSGSACTR